MPLHGVFKAAMNGIHTRGDGGFVYVKGDSCAYMFPDELVGQDQLRNVLSAILSTEAARRMFYVAEESDGELKMRAYERAQVLEDALEETTTERNASRIVEM